MTPPHPQWYVFVFYGKPRKMSVQIAFVYKMWLCLCLVLEVV